MTLPSLVIGFLIASIIGTLFNLIRGGGPGRLLLILILAWIGFWGGHALATYWQISLYSVGPLQLGLAIAGCIIGSGIGYWLSLVDFSEIN